MHPAAVARLVMKRTDHCLLVGEGALAVRPGARLPRGQPPDRRGPADLAPLEGDQRQGQTTGSPPPDDELDPAVREFFGIREHGTIHCSALDTHGDLGCVTTTSGLYYKIPGRVGDSPILGAGLFLDNEVGSAGSTGRGEANLLNLSSHTIVEALRRGPSPKDAALEACKRIAATNQQPAAPRRQGPAELRRQVLLPGQGRPIRRRQPLGRARRWPSTTATRPGWSIARPFTTTRLRTDGPATSYRRYRQPRAGKPAHSFGSAGVSRCLAPALETE